MREAMRLAREKQQQKARDIVKLSVEAEKKRKHEERERHKRALEVRAGSLIALHVWLFVPSALVTPVAQMVPQAVENYDPSKHNGFDVKKNPLMSGGHGKTFTNRPRFGRVKPGCGPSG